MEEYAKPEGEVHLEPTRENMPSEQPEVQPVARQQRKKRKDKQQEGEEDEFVSEEAYSIWKKHYAGKGFVGERGFSQLISSTSRRLNVATLQRHDVSASSAFSSLKAKRVQNWWHRESYEPGHGN